MEDSQQRLHCAVVCSCGLHQVVTDVSSGLSYSSKAQSHSFRELSKIKSKTRTYIGENMNEGRGHIPRVVRKGLVETLLMRIR